MADVSVWTSSVVEDTQAKIALLQLSGMQVFETNNGSMHIGAHMSDLRQLYLNLDGRWRVVQWPFGGFGVSAEWHHVRRDHFRSLTWDMINQFLQT